MKLIGTFVMHGRGPRMFLLPPLGGIRDKTYYLTGAQRGAPSAIFATIQFPERCLFACLTIGSV